MPRSANIPAEWARYQTDVREEPDERHSRQIVTFEHPGNKIGKVQQSEINNEKHLITLMLSQMKNMKEQIINLKSEQIQAMKRQEQMQNALGKIREHKEKLVYCFHCNMYTGEVHFCTREKQWIHLDRFNRITIYSDTEEGATPRQENYLLGSEFEHDVIRMKKFAIDERETIMIEKKEKKAEMEKQQRIKKDAQQLSQLMNIIFGESSNLEITEELNTNLDEFRKSNKWNIVNTCLGYHPDTPRGILSSEQWSSFHFLRNNDKKVLDKHNKMAREKQKETERKRQEEEQQEEICKRQEQRQREEQREQIMQIRRRQNDAFEENFRMVNLYHN
jgi:hypothetical protein